MRHPFAPVALSLVALASPARAEIELSLPVACTIGADCLVQQLPDLDGGPGAADPFCGTATYDGHKGTDFALRSLAAAERNVAVLAPAPGTVAGVRDGEADRAVATPGDRAAVGNRECGNGVGIDHGGGWFTQVCHLREGSVRVRPGQRVERGQSLGAVGYSGMAQFAHVHLQVMRNGEPVDPFTGAALGTGCVDGDAVRPLWMADAAEAIGRPGTQALGVGVADAPVDADRLWIEGRPREPVGERPPVAVAWGAAVNLRAGDVMRVELLGPDGVLALNEETMERTRARQMLFAGVRRPEGPVRARLSVTRDGMPVLEDERGVTAK